jgi:hypothetical protein
MTRESRLVVKFSNSGDGQGGIGNARSLGALDTTLPR